MSDGRWRTDDMALVAYLAIQSFDRIECENHNGTVKWVYEDSDELQREVDVYRRRCAVVEPKQFMLRIATVRDDMRAVASDY